MAAQQPAPFCLHCGIHHTPDQRHRPVRAWFRKRRTR
jgi:hypothetical protein